MKPNKVFYPLQVLRNLLFLVVAIVIEVLKLVYFFLLGAILHIVNISMAH